jgi:outer membrane protein
MFSTGQAALPRLAKTCLRTSKRMVRTPHLLRLASFTLCMYAWAAPSWAQEEKPSIEDQVPKKVLPVDQEAEARHARILSLTVMDAMQRGRRFNVSLKAAELLPEQARLDLLFAEAGFQPELYSNTGYGESESPQRNAFQPSIKSQTVDATMGWRQRVVTGGLFDLAFQPTRFDSNGGNGAFPSRQFSSEWSASFRQPLLRGGWTGVATAPITSARYRMNQANYEYDRSVQDTLFNIVQAYWELVYARENWHVVDSSLSIAQEQLRITLERIRVEDLAPRDRVSDEAEVARRREELIVAENSIRDREDNLRRLLYDGNSADMWSVNLRPVSPISVSLEGALPSFESLVEVALQSRPELRSQRSSIAAAEVAEIEARSNILPQLDLIGSYSSDGVSSDDTSLNTKGSFGNAFRDASDQEFPDWSVRLEFAIPLGNQAARSRSRRARLEVERQRRLLHASAIEITREVREALRRLKTLRQSIRATLESVRLATTNLETEQVKLRVGASTAFEVQGRNQELREARGRLLRNQLDYRTAESRLLYVQGLLQVDAN